MLRHYLVLRYTELFNFFKLDPNMQHFEPFIFKFIRNLFKFFFN